MSQLFGSQGPPKPYYEKLGIQIYLDSWARSNEFASWSQYVVQDAPLGIPAQIPQTPRTLPTFIPVPVLQTAIMIKIDLIDQKRLWHDVETVHMSDEQKREARKTLKRTLSWERQAREKQGEPPGYLSGTGAGPSPPPKYTSNRRRSEPASTMSMMGGRAAVARRYMIRNRSILGQRVLAHGVDTGPSTSPIYPGALHVIDDRRRGLVSTIRPEDAPDHAPITNLSPRPPLISEDSEAPPGYEHQEARNSSDSDEGNYGPVGDLVVDGLQLDRQRFASRVRPTIPSTHTVSDSVVTTTAEANRLRHFEDAELGTLEVGRPLHEQRLEYASSDRLFHPTANTLNVGAFDDSEDGLAMSNAETRRSNVPTNPRNGQPSSSSDTTSAAGTSSRPRVRRQHVRRATLEQEEFERELAELRFHSLVGGDQARGDLLRRVSDTDAQLLADIGNH